MDFFTSLTPYHWIALGLLLLVAEMLGASGFLLGAAVAALAMGAVTWIAPELDYLMVKTVHVEDGKANEAILTGATINGRKL